MNLAWNLERSAFYFPDRPALSEDGAETSYTRLDSLANRVATALINMGVRPGDHIGLCAPNSGDWLAFYFGILKAGGVAVTLSSLLKRDELALLLTHARPRILFTFDEKLDGLEELRKSEWLERVICPGGDLSFEQLLAMGSGSFGAVERDRSDTAVVLYTGGTTGAPKGVMLSESSGVIVAPL